MFSLSTSWNSGRHNEGIGLVKEIKLAGFDCIELGFSLTEDMVISILSEKEAGRIRVSSIHNMCPLPAEIGREHPSPDHYSLSSHDSVERKLAVDIAKNTIKWASRLGAKAVVLHAGRVRIKDRMRELALLADDKGRFIEFRDNMIKERRDNAAGCLDNVVRSLEELIPYSKDKGVCLGVENRYHHREIPLIDEFEVLFSRFAPGELFYWHDVGHAEVFERFGFYKHMALLDKLAGRLLGVHLHDILGLMDDHRPPGSGTFDFRKLKPYLKSDTIKVIEIHEPAGIEDVRKASKFLSGIFG